MPIRSASISVGTTAVALASNSDLRSSPRLIVANMGGSGAGIVYLGDATVSSTTGLALASNAAPLGVNTGGGPLYAVSGGGTQTVRILEEY